MRRLVEGLSRAIEAGFGPPVPNRQYHVEVLLLIAVVQDMPPIRPAEQAPLLYVSAFRVVHTVVEILEHKIVGEEDEETCHPECHSNAKVPPVPERPCHTPERQPTDCNERYAVPPREADIDLVFLALEMVGKVVAEDTVVFFVAIAREREPPYTLVHIVYVELPLRP